MPQMRLPMGNHKRPPHDMLPKLPTQNKKRQRTTQQGRQIMKERIITSFPPGAGDLPHSNTTTACAQGLYPLLRDLITETRAIRAQQQRILNEINLIWRWISDFNKTLERTKILHIQDPDNDIFNKR